VKYQKFPGCEALIDTDHGEKEIDLRELVGLFPNGSARFSVMGGVEDNQERYSWSVCDTTTVPEQSECRDQLFYYEKLEKGTCDGIATVGSFVIRQDEITRGKSLVLELKNPKDSVKRTSITLVCDRTVDGPGNLLCDEGDGMPCLGMFEINFIFKSPHVCLGEPAEEAPAGGQDKKPWKFSIGSIILMSAGSMFVTYMIVGLAYGTNKGEKGLNRLPNSDFWMELPLLVKDGMKFFFRGCKPPGVLYSPIIEDKNVPIVDV